MIRLLYQSLTPPERDAFYQTIATELNRLWDIDLGAGPAQARPYDAVLDELGGRLGKAAERTGAAYPGAETVEMIRFLCSDRTRPLQSHVGDLAQICFLEREHRQEYLDNRNQAPPYHISKLLLEYALKSRQLDRIQDALTKDFCATRCHRLPTGCCSVPGYDMNLVTQAMLEVQVLEAKRARHPFPEVDKRCKYHGPRGCVLTLFKSPACIGFLCDALQRFLASVYPARQLDLFFEHLFAFRNCYLDRRYIFDTMDAAIRAGRHLIQA